MAIKRFLTEEQGAELQALYDQFAVATAKAAATMKSHGMSSPQFAADDYAAGEIMERINKLVGRNHWLG